MINIKHKKNLIYLFSIILLFYSNSTFANSIDLSCLKINIENQLSIEDTQFDGIYDFDIKIKSKKKISLINSNTKDEYYKIMFNQIKQILRDNYSKCRINCNTIVKITVDTSESGVKITLTLKA